METTLTKLHALMESNEDEHLEFKAAKRQLDFGTMVQYCAALANEGGGKLVLGVSDKKPRIIKGTLAFPALEKTKKSILDELHFRVDIEEIGTPEGRVLIFSVPSRPSGTPIGYRGKFLMRSGGSLVAMTPEILQRIFAETGPDYSAVICEKASFEDLSALAVARFRAQWIRKSGNERLKTLSDKQLLADAELATDAGLTYAALILLGTREALGKCLPQAEVIYEYRSSESSVAYQKRHEYREGFFLYHNGLWNAINTRNDIQQFQDGLFRWDIPTFNESVVREAVLNAVCHRDYRLGNSVFVRQYPKKLAIVSPGGFIEGITPDNIIWKQAWRNRRVVEVLGRCGPVERSGQGANRMFEECIKESKATPDFTGTDEYRVSVTLHGEIQDVRFLRFLERLGHETLSSFSTEDLLVIDALHRERTVPSRLKESIRYLKERGIIETVGRGRGTRHILSHRFYDFIGKKGVYTRKKGLDRETNKTLLLKHIQRCREEGSRLQELMEVLPSLKPSQVQSLLRDLRAEGRIYHTGRTKGSRWYPAQQPSHKHE